jgi:hypothetical protein
VNLLIITAVNAILQPLKIFVIVHVSQDILELSHKSLITNVQNTQTDLKKRPLTIGGKLSQNINSVDEL